MKYNELPISSVATIISGGTPKTTIFKYWNGSIPWLSVKDFNNGMKYVYETEKHISEDGLNNSATNLLHKNDIILSARGTVGELAMISRDMAFNQSCFGLRATENILPDFLYYALKNSVSKIKNNAHGSVFDTITLKDFDNIRICVPDLETQKKVVRILSAFDNKIELNNQQNQTLMDAALSVYRKLLTQYGSEWIDGYVDDGVTTKIAKSGVAEYSGVKKYVATADVSGANITHFEEIEYKNRPSRANMMPVNNTVWFAKMEGSVKNILVADFSKEFQDDYIFSTGFMGVECLKDSLYYIWCYINDDKFLDTKNALSTGTLMAGISNKTIKKAKYVIPPKDLLNDFNKAVRPIFEKIHRNTIQIESMAKTRDALLPKLMNSEINLERVNC